MESIQEKSTYRIICYFCQNLKMKPNSAKFKMLFLIPLLGLITSFSFGFSSHSNLEGKNFKTELHSLVGDKIHPCFKYINEEDYEKTKFLVDESESEIDLESDWYFYSNISSTFLELTEETKDSVYSNNFFALQYKIPLYKLFCKWKLHLN